MMSGRRHGELKKGLVKSRFPEAESQFPEDKSGVPPAMARPGSYEIGATVLSLADKRPTYGRR
jgi:hypothetical protein